MSTWLGMGILGTLDLYGNLGGKSGGASRPGSRSRSRPLILPPRGYCLCKLLMDRLEKALPTPLLKLLTLSFAEGGGVNESLPRALSISLTELRVLVRRGGRGGGGCNSNGLSISSSVSCNPNTEEALVRVDVLPSELIEIRLLRTVLELDMFDMLEFTLDILP